MTVTKRDEDEETLKRRIKHLKKQEKRIREERHRLEAQLREKIFKRYKKIYEKIEDN
ncbi:MAG: syntaphilin domain-containing protein [Candidatus Bathyarchaeota archaeon]|nr:syntaphilin domain-containing protein [Candidatus Bathyarchaeota archaeon]